MSELTSTLLSCTLILGILVFVFLVMLLSRPRRGAVRVYCLFPQLSRQVSLEKRSALARVFEENFGHDQEVHA